MLGGSRPGAFSQLLERWGGGRASARSSEGPTLKLKTHGQGQWMVHRNRKDRSPKPTRDAKITTPRPVLNKRSSASKGGGGEGTTAAGQPAARARSTGYHGRGAAELLLEASAWRYCLGWVRVPAVPGLDAGSSDLDPSAAPKATREVLEIGLEPTISSLGGRRLIH